MRIETVEGIIISETNYGESSKIINVLTKEFGLLGVMCKGCRRLKSKLNASTRKLIYANFNIYYKEGKMSTLISTDIINSYQKTTMDLEKLSYASLILELIYQVEKQTSEDIFTLLRDCLEKIEEGLNPEVITCIIELKLLDYLGVRPNIDSCSDCGSTKDIVTLSSSRGGYICKNCYDNDGLVSQKTIKLIRMFLYVDIRKITKLDVSKESIFEVSRFLDDYYDRFTGIYLKNKEFIKKVNYLTNL